MPDPNYPTGAYAALAPPDGGWPSAESWLDCLAAMSPEDRAALARWVWPEGESQDVLVGELHKSLKRSAQYALEVEAATVKRIAGWLRSSSQTFDVREDARVADAIEREFGGPDAR